MSRRIEKNQRARRVPDPLVWIVEADDSNPAGVVEICYNRFLGMMLDKEIDPRVDEVMRRINK
jgi:hypothetical protein